MARVLVRIYPFAAAVWALALVMYARPLAPRSVVGLTLVLVGWAGAAWAAGYRASGKDAPGSEAGSYLFSGPYGWVRNPSQIATACVAVGLAIWSGAFRPWAAVVTAVLLVAVFTVIQCARDEEAERRLGWAYRAFRATVPIWVPRFTPRPGLGEGRWGPEAALRGSLPSVVGALLVAAAAFLVAHVDVLRLLP